MMSKQICRKKMLGQHFRYHQTPGQMHCAVQMMTNLFMSARQKLTMLFNVYRVIDPTPSFPSAHTALATGKHTLMRRENGLVHGSSAQLIEDDE